MAGFTELTEVGHGSSATLHFGNDICDQVQSRQMESGLADSPGKAVLPAR
jgi:hypothetical protein